MSVSEKASLVTLKGQSFNVMLNCKTLGAWPNNQITQCGVIYIYLFKLNTNNSTKKRIIDERYSCNFVTKRKMLNFFLNPLHIYIFGHIQ